MSKEKDKEKHLIDDWMARISFAEAGEPDLGFKATGVDIERKTRFAMDKVMVVRAEKESAAADKGGSTPKRPKDIPEGQRLRVMILDDEPEVGKRLTPSLRAAGFEVETFLDPVRAVARLDEKEFDIIVTDFQMDEMDGIEVLEHIMEKCKNTRVILITAYGTVEIAREALTKGAFDFITKPFKPKELRAVVNKAAMSLGHKPIRR